MEEICPAFGISPAAGTIRNERKFAKIPNSGQNTAPPD